MDRNDEIETRGRVETEHFYLKKKETRFFLWKFWVNPKKHVARTRSDYFSELIDFGIHSELGWYGSWTAAE